LKPSKELAASLEIAFFESVVEAFLGQGLISAQQADGIVAQAAQSGCGFRLKIKTRWKALSQRVPNRLQIR